MFVMDERLIVCYQTQSRLTTELRILAGIQIMDWWIQSEGPVAHAVMFGTSN